VTKASRGYLVRLGISVTALVGLSFLLEPREVASRLSGLRPGWVGAALGVSVAQVILSAWRWRFTAARLGVDIPLRRAISEYYLGTFLNQVLPGGVLGDVSRAWRHARAEPDLVSTPRIHAVVFERTSGQAVMTGVALASGAVVLMGTSAGGARSLAPAASIPAWIVLPALVAAALTIAWVAAGLLRRAFGADPVGRFLEDARSSLWGSAFPVQVATSLVIVASYVVVYLFAARAVGVDTSTAVLLPLAPLVLVTMLLPISVAGWGVREGAAAALWSSMGLTPTDGVAISVAYGLLVLISSLPGALVLLATVRADGAPGRRGGPGRTESVAR